MHRQHRDRKSRGSPPAAPAGGARRGPASAPRSPGSISYIRDKLSVAACLKEQQLHLLLASFNRAWYRFINAPSLCSSLHRLAKSHPAGEPRAAAASRALAGPRLPQETRFLVRGTGGVHLQILRCGISRTRTSSLLFAQVLSAFVVSANLRNTSAQTAQKNVTTPGSWNSLCCDPYHSSPFFDALVCTTWCFRPPWFRIGLGHLWARGKWVLNIRQISSWGDWPGPLNVRCAIVEFMHIGLRLHNYCLVQHGISADKKCTCPPTACLQQGQGPMFVSVSLVSQPTPFCCDRACRHSRLVCS